MASAVGSQGGQPAAGTSGAGTFAGAALVFAGVGLGVNYFLKRYPSLDSRVRWAISGLSGLGAVAACAQAVFSGGSSRPKGPSGKKPELIREVDFVPTIKMDLTLKLQVGPGSLASVVDRDLADAQQFIHDHLDEKGIPEELELLDGTFLLENNRFPFKPDVYRRLLSLLFVAKGVEADFANRTGNWPGFVNERKWLKQVFELDDLLKVQHTEQQFAVLCAFAGSSAHADEFLCRFLLEQKERVTAWMTHRKVTIQHESEAGSQLAEALNTDKTSWLEFTLSGYTPPLWTPPEIPELTSYLESLDGGAQRWTEFLREVYIYPLEKQTEIALALQLVEEYQEEGEYAFGGQWNALKEAAVGYDWKPSTAEGLSNAFAVNYWCGVLAERLAPDETKDPFGGLRGRLSALVFRRLFEDIPDQGIGDAGQLVELLRRYPEPKLIEEYVVDTLVGALSAPPEESNDDAVKLRNAIGSTPLEVTQLNPVVPQSQLSGNINSALGGTRDTEESPQARLDKRRSHLQRLEQEGVLEFQPSLDALLTSNSC